MNPLSTVASSDAAPEADDASLRKALEGFDVVCIGLGVLAWDVARSSRIDAMCREAGSVFVQSLSFGELAFFFTDMHEHVIQVRSGPQGGAGSVAAAGAEAAAT